MKVTIEDAGQCRRVVHIEVPGASVEDEFIKVVSAFAGAAKVPGFRKGKAPARVVEKTYNKQIVEEVQDRMLPVLYQRAVKEEEGLNPAAVVDVGAVKCDRGSGMRFSVTLDVEPTFSLPKYKKITLKLSPVEVSDDDVSKALLRLRESGAKFDAITDRPAADGDLVSVDYNAVCDGKPLSEVATECSGLDQSKDFWAMLGDSEFIPGFSAAMAGAYIGDNRTFPVEFPQDFGVEAVRGLSADYSVTVKAIRSRVLPELDEEFLKKLDVESEQQLEERIRTDLTEAGEAEEKRRQHDEIAQFLLSHVDCELPDSVVTRETGAIARDMVQRFAVQGADKDQISERRDEILTSARQAALDRVKINYILARIADAESIEVDDGEVEKRIDAIAASRRIAVSRVKSELKENDGMDALRGSLRGEKALEYVLSVAKIKK